jgi:hypothetical protein
MHAFLRKSARNALLTGLLLGMAGTGLADAHGSGEKHGAMAGHDTGENSAAPAMVLFLTRTDPMVAGHALHFLETMKRTGADVTLILVGDAGSFALAGHEVAANAISNKSFSEELRALAADGGRVLITPYTLAMLEAEPSDLVAGVTLPMAAQGLHEKMLAPGTKLLVW